MKTFTFLLVLWGTAYSALAEAPTWQELNSHLFTNAVIVWQVLTNQLPSDFMVYRRTVPRIFPRTLITNAIVLASFQSKGYPEPSTNITCLLDDPGCDCPCPRACNFGIEPMDSSLNYYSPVQTHTTNQIPDSQTVDALARTDALKLGIDLAQITPRNQMLHFNTDTNDNSLTNQIISRSIYLCRKLNGINFFSADDEGDGSEGFEIEFGSYGLIRSFSFCWSEVQPYQRQPAASLQLLTNCIRAHKPIVLPNPEENTYFQRLQALAHARTLTITKIIPCYVGEFFGDEPTNDVPAKFVVPCAELEATADLGTSNIAVRMLSPILSSEITRSPK